VSLSPICVSIISVPLDTISGLFAKGHIDQILLRFIATMVYNCARGLIIYGGENWSPWWRYVVNPVRSGRKQPQQPIRVPG